MSKRITTQTDIKDKGLAIKALGQLGLAYEEMGSTSLRITSGTLGNAVIDLTTGKVSGDTDYGHRRESLGDLRQAYAELKFRADAAKEGVQIKQRFVRQDGKVRLVCRMASRATA